MKQRLSKWLSVISLTLCIAYAALWAHSRCCGWTLDVVTKHQDGRHSVAVTTIGCDNGSLFLRRLSGDDRQPNVPLIRQWIWRRTVPNPWSDTLRNLTTFQWVKDASGTSFHGAVFPIRPVVVLTAVMPAIRLVCRHRQRRRTWDRCCQACGYDLRATPGRCPEWEPPPKISS